MHVIIDLHIYFNYLHWAFCHLFVYSSFRSFNHFIVCLYIILPCSFEHFYVYLHILILRISLLIFLFWYFYFDPNTLVCSHPTVLVLLARVDFLCYFSLIHPCAFVLYLVISASAIPRIMLQNFTKRTPCNVLVKQSPIISRVGQY